MEIKFIQMPLKEGGKMIMYPTVRQIKRFGVCSLPTIFRVLFQNVRPRLSEKVFLKSVYLKEQQPQVLNGSS